MADDEFTTRLHKLASANIVHGQAFHLKLPDGWLGGIAITADGPVSFEWTEYGGKERHRKLSPSGVVTLAKPVGS
ncbi:hypothetical protein ACFQ9V_05800 [Leifsonia sp. NPDC056665]|uniref:hypothetical protein n=1 Tax=Leifsonia sp. NPDC056665 TaxID=3345901 RepID=UPI0036CC4F37